jgi:hypothetical protein
MAGGTPSNNLPLLDSRHDILSRRAVSTQNHAEGSKHPLPNRYGTSLEMWPRGDKWQSVILPSRPQRRPMVHFWTAWIDSGHLLPLVISFLVDSTAQLRRGSKGPDEVDPRRTVVPNVHFDLFTRNPENCSRNGNPPTLPCNRPHDRVLPAHVGIHVVLENSVRSRPLVAAMQ